MAIESQNIYKNARKSAGFTQEKASQLLNVSVDSLRDYEQSQRPVPSDVASAMCDVYQAPYLAVQHHHYPAGRWRDRRSRCRWRGSYLYP